MTIEEHCDSYKKNLAVVKDIKYDVWVGEWSLATDHCALWLGGFKDNNVQYVYACDFVDCPYSYISNESLAVDFDRTANYLGPYGSGETQISTIQKGKCSKDSNFFNSDDVMTLG